MENQSERRTCSHAPAEPGIISRHATHIALFSLPAFVRMTSLPDRLTRIFLRALKQSLAASRGGPMRVRILRLLLAQPANPFTLSKSLGVDYKTITHHLSKLQHQQLVIRSEEKYGSHYRVTFTPSQREAFEKWLDESGKRL